MVNTPKQYVYTYIDCETKTINSWTLYHKFTKPKAKKDFLQLWKVLLKSV